MKFQKVLFLSLIIGMVGCVPSLHQLWTEKTLTYDPHFVGTFGDPDDDEKHWTIVGDPDKKAYRITIDEGDAPDSVLIGHLVDVQGNLFFDFYPDGELKAGDWTKFHLLGVHLFYRIEKTKTGFNLSMMDHETVNDLLKEKPSLVKHEMVADGEGDEVRAVLTDKPENLQKFLLEGLKIEDFFGDPGEFKRIITKSAPEAPEEEPKPQSESDSLPKQYSFVLVRT